MDVRTQQKLALGRDYYRAGKFTTALPLLLEVLAEHETFADVHNMLGVIEHQLGRGENAMRHLERALELNPMYAEAALHLAICYEEEGRYEDAHQVYARAVRARGSTEEAALNQVDEVGRMRIANLHGELGDAYAALGLPGRAAREYRLALESGVNFADIRLKLATTLRDLGRPKEALQELLRLREDRPEFLAARVQLGVTLWACERRDEARAEWSFVIARDPDNRMAKFYLAAFPPRRPRGSNKRALE